MLSRLFRRRPPAEDPPEVSEEAATAKRGWRQRARALFEAAWNWTILLAAIAAALVCARLTLYFWLSGGIAVEGSVAAAFRVLAGAASAAATVYLAWQIWQGVRYFRHRRNGG